MSGATHVIVLDNLTYEQWEVLNRLRRWLRDEDLRTRMQAACEAFVGDRHYFSEAFQSMLPDALDDSNRGVMSLWSRVAAERPSSIVLTGVAAYMLNLIGLDELLFLKGYSRKLQERLYGQVPTRHTHRLMEIELGPSSEHTLKLFSDQRIDDADGNPPPPGA